MKKTKYAGTQTEKNLMAAFAGESEARNKYTYFASKAKKEGYEQKMRRSTLSSGSRNSTASVIPPRISVLLLRARTTSGRICTRALPRPRRKKASGSWRPASVWWLLLRSTTRSATVPCCTMWKWQRSLPRARSRCGNAATVVTLWWGRRLPRCAPPAIIPRAISRFMLKTIN